MSTQHNEMTLTFDLLEDAMNLDDVVRDNVLNNSKLLRIGPLVEFLYQTSENKIALFKDSDITAPLKKALLANNFVSQPQNTSLKANSIEFIRSYRSDEEEGDARWFAFCKRLQDAAIKSGLQQEFAKALASTFEEMTGNLAEHSRAPDTGIVGYKWKQGEFEYIVADSGVGVLNSLKRSSQYSYIKDSGQALETALQDGRSSTDIPGRGFGFRKLLTNIANRNSYLRFRSGDHYYSIDGTKSEPVSKTKSCTILNGFLISVVCKS